MKKSLKLSILMSLIIGVHAPVFANPIQVTGDITYNYGHVNLEGHHSHINLLETCIYLNGSLNDNWSLKARIENDQDFTDNDFEGKTEVNQYWAEGRVGGMQLVAGKAPQFLVNGNVYDETAKMISLSYGNYIKYNAYYGEPEDFGFDKFYGASATINLGTRWTLSAGYDKFENALASIEGFGIANNIPLGEDNAIWNAYIKHRYRDLAVDFTYLDSDKENGYVVGASYKGADAIKPGSFGLRANWYDQGNGTYVVHTMYGDKDMAGFKGNMLATDFTVAKNVVATVEYYDLENKVDKTDVDTLWSKLMIAF